MPIDEGLMPPPKPTFIAQTQALSREPDLDANMLRDSVRDLFGRQSEYLQRWGDVIETAKDTPYYPGHVPFSGTGGDVLKPIESVLHEAVGSDPSLLGTIKAVTNSFMTSFGRPVAAITDLVMAGKINDLQKKFLLKHARDLDQLSRTMNKGKRAMRELSDILAKTTFDGRTLEQILIDKQRLGNDFKHDLNDAIENETDPEKKRQLEAVKNDFDEWSKDRDARIESEQKTVNEMATHLTNLEKQMRQQEKAFMDAGSSDGPRTLTGPNGEVYETTHTRPDALQHVGSLYELLLGSRVAMNTAIEGNTGYERINVSPEQ